MILGGSIVLGACGFQILVIRGPFDILILLVPHEKAKNLKGAGAWGQSPENPPYFLKFLENQHSR